MHHHPRSRERSLACQSRPCLDLVSFPALGQIRPQAPRLMVLFRQFLQVSDLCPYYPQNPYTFISGWISQSIALQDPSRHSLQSGLRRYLIVFDTLTFVLCRRKHFRQMLSLLLVFDRSKNFTSRGQVLISLNAPKTRNLTS